MTSIQLWHPVMSRFSHKWSVVLFLKLWHPAITPRLPRRSKASVCVSGRLFFHASLVVLWIWYITFAVFCRNRYFREYVGVSHGGLRLVSCMIFHDHRRRGLLGLKYMRMIIILCSDQQVVNTELRYRNNALCFLDKNCPSFDVHTHTNKCMYIRMCAHPKCMR